ncbi:MAG: class I adenylate-forming enzyme family protein, partial [Smithellaceae bacterium]|nr:class I adenylate-forming enzyme family protein [Smithellaceae bacterium]
MDLYDLSNRMPISSLIPFTDIKEELTSAFADSGAPFLYYWSLGDGRLGRRVFTRGEFWRLSLAAAGLYREMGLQRGDRVMHGFSGNNPYDLLFRLAGIMTGCVPVTINWQADDRERISAKISLTGARLFLYDRGLEKYAASLKQDHPDLLLFGVWDLDNHEAGEGDISRLPALDEEKMIIFTSGTTGFPKGVSLSHRNYLANRLTFEGYFHLGKDDALDLLLVNPLHHANSSALADWGMRRTGAIIHLVE